MRIAVAAQPPLILPDGSGYLDRILLELFTRAGLVHEIVMTPPRRGLHDTEDGILDAAIVPFQKVSRIFTKMQLLSESLIPTELAGLYIRDNLVLTTLDDFSDYRLAYITGWKQPLLLFGDHPDVEKVPDETILMNMLIEGRVDVIFYSTVPGRYIAKSLGVTNLKVSEYHVQRHLYLHFNPRHEKLLPDLKKHLSDMKRDGTIDSILSDYPIEH